MIWTGSAEEMRATAVSFDENDVLARFRGGFNLPSTGIYLDGNSLGAHSAAAEAAVLSVLLDWKTKAVEGWTTAEPAWFTLAEGLGASMAALLGAEPEEVVVTNSTTVNLHQLLATLYQPVPGRDIVLADRLNFPSDGYAVESHIRLRGLDPLRQIVHVESRDGWDLDEADIIESMRPDVAVAVLPAVLYVSGRLLDMEALTRAAHARGVLIGFDCSHSAGCVPHRLTEWGVDFAFWCGYKYLNGGPGSAAGLFLNRRHFGSRPGLAGWFGSRKDRQFDMAPDLDYAIGPGALQIGTPNILSMAPLSGTVPVLLEAGIERIREKSLAMTDLLLALADERLASYGVTVVSPRERSRRGGHVALSHPKAVQLCAALKGAGVVPDFRPPNVIRLAPVALYNTFVECCSAIEKLEGILAQGEFTRLDGARGLVA